MAFTARRVMFSAGGDGSVSSWSTYLDYGGTADIFKPQLSFATSKSNNGSSVFGLVNVIGSALGRTYDCLYGFNLAKATGAFVDDNIIEVNADAEKLDIPLSTDEYHHRLIAASQSSTTRAWYIAANRSTTPTDYLNTFQDIDANLDVQTDLAIPTEIYGIAVLSNDDLWIYTDNTMTLLDRSSSYGASLVNQRIDGAGVRITSGIVDSDILYFAGGYGVSFMIGAVNSSGTILDLISGYRYNDTGDTNIIKNIFLDNGSNLYFLWRAFDSSAGTYKTMVSRRSASGINWTVSLGDLGGDARLAVCNGSLYVLDSNGSSNDSYLVKLNILDGSKAGEVTYSCTSNSIINKTIFADDGALYVSGIWQTSGYDRGVAVLKIPHSETMTPATKDIWTIATSTAITVTDETANVTIGASGYSTTTFGASSPPASNLAVDPITMTANNQAL